MHSASRLSVPYTIRSMSIVYWSKRPQRIEETNYFSQRRKRLVIFIGMEQGSRDWMKFFTDFRGQGSSK